MKFTLITAAVLLASSFALAQSAPAAKTGKSKAAKPAPAQRQASKALQDRMQSEADVGMIDVTPGRAKTAKPGGRAK